MLLASRIDAAAALDAVSHSSGATFSMNDHDGRRCADLALVTTTRNDPVVIGALDRWIVAAGPANASRSSQPGGRSLVVAPARMPGGAPTVLLVKEGAPVLTSCNVSVAPYGSFIIPFAQLAARNAAIAGALRHGVDDTAAACIGHAVLTDEEYRSALHRALDRNRDLPGDARAHVARRAAKACGTAV
jgi:hypothetical protein